MKLAFLTSTPLNVREGSGSFVGIYRLARSLRQLGVDVEIVAPECHLPIYAIERLWFNEQLEDRRFDDCDLTVGFDMDGCLLSRRPHVASIKGVLADEARFERGLTRWSMSIQAMCEALHVRRADLVITTSSYAAAKLQQCYAVDRVAIVPELIDLRRWRDAGGQPDAHRFTVLCVCRLFPRKRVDVLLRAAALVRERIPELRVRIVGDGPERGKLRRLWSELQLERTVEWLGALAPAQLAPEYRRANVFCLPSVQEGFGIVFLEAMAAGVPIVAARAAAAPEVAPHAVLVEPESAAALAAGIEQLYREPALRAAIAEAGSTWVEQFDAPRVARRFLDEVEKVR